MKKLPYEALCPSCGTYVPAIIYTSYSNKPRFARHLQSRHAGHVNCPNGGFVISDEHAQRPLQSNWLRSHPLRPGERRRNRHCAKPPAAESIQALAQGDGRLLNEYEVASLFSISVSAVRKWREREVGPRYVKLGRLVRYRPEGLLAFIDSLPQP